MPKIFSAFTKWCNSNGGLLTFIFGLIAVLIAILNNYKINLGDATSFLSYIITVLNYKIQLPLYLCLMIILVMAIYLMRVKNKRQRITFNFLVGKWFNEYSGDKESGYENAEIEEGGKYYVEGKHCFNITNFKYDYQLNQISFVKTSVIVGENREVKAILNIHSKNMICGKEGNSNIRYTRELSIPTLSY